MEGNEDGEMEGNEDIFNNEAMENPTEDESARFKMPAERRTSGPSAQNDEELAVEANEDEGDGKDEDGNEGAARFEMPARRNTPGIFVTAQSQKLAQNPEKKTGLISVLTQHTGVLEKVHMKMKKLKKMSQWSMNRILNLEAGLPMNLQTKMMTKIL